MGESTRPEIPTLIAMMMPRDTNPHGIIFGGVLLSYIDQAGAIHAQEIALENSWDIKFVTVAMDKIEFNKPVHVGDVLSLFTETLRTGKSSIVVEVKAHTNHYQDAFVTKGTLTFVAVDEHRKPVRIFGD